MNGISRSQNSSGRRWISLSRSLCALISAAAGVVFLWPAVIVVEAIFDPGMNSAARPKLARRLHASLSARYEKWARQRVAGGKAGHVHVHDVAGTEWPLFGSVFYLWATEALQADWVRDPAPFPAEPRVAAAGAIDAAVRVVADPQHATWVKTHWGDRYLDTENVFYRMLLINALTAHVRLLRSAEFLPLLRAQVDALSQELDASPHGLLDDYPRECYPTDVMAAVAAIHRADAVLGTDHSAFVARSLRGFTGRSSGILGLPPYFADSRTGAPLDDSRGCSNSYMTLSAPALWPDAAREWYRLYEQHFWQRDYLAAGFREFPKRPGSKEWYFDVDAGPVLRGIGFAASSFGVAAARTNGRFDQAYPLTIEMLAASWPLPGGRLLVPWLVSDLEHAPLLGEVGILYQLATSPVPQTLSRHHAGPLPLSVFLLLSIYFAGGYLCLRIAWRCAEPAF